MERHRCKRSSVKDDDGPAETAGMIYRSLLLKSSLARLWIYCNSVVTMLYSTIVPLAFGIGAAAQVTAQNSSGTRLRVDNGTYGPEIEEVHYCE